MPADASGSPLLRGWVFENSKWESDDSYVEPMLDGFGNPIPGVPGALVFDINGQTLLYSSVYVGHYFVNASGQPVDENGLPLPVAEGANYLYAGKRDTLGLPYWHMGLNPPYRDSIPIHLLPAGTQLKPFYETAPGRPVIGQLRTLIPARLQDGRNLHVYRPNGADGYVRSVYDTFINAKGTDWIDLSSDQRTIFYTSEYGIVHRYDTETGTQP